jgi:DnaJ-class molecular chaperone
MSKEKDRLEYIRGIVKEKNSRIQELEAQAKADQLKLEHYHDAMSKLDGAYKKQKKELDQVTEERDATIDRMLELCEEKDGLLRELRQDKELFLGICKTCESELNRPCNCKWQKRIDEITEITTPQALKGQCKTCGGSGTIVDNSPCPTHGNAFCTCARKLLSPCPDCKEDVNE